MIYTRDEFKKLLNIDFDNYGAFAYERAIGVESKWFVEVNSFESTNEYWDWINSHLESKAICYLAGTTDATEIWGFAKETDMFLWMLKWA